LCYFYLGLEDVCVVTESSLPPPSSSTHLSKLEEPDDDVTDITGISAIRVEENSDCMRKSESIIQQMDYHLKNKLYEPMLTETACCLFSVWNNSLLDWLNFILLMTKSILT